MTEKENNPRQTAPNQNRREVSTTDNKNDARKDKSVGVVVDTQQIAGTDVRVVRHLGKLYIPEIDVAKGLDQERNNFRHLMERNSELLDAYPYEVMVTSQGQRRKLRLLSFENVRAAVLFVDHNVADPERKEFLVARKKEYLKIINDFYAKKSVEGISKENWVEVRKNAATSWTRLCNALKEKVVPFIQNPADERFVYINEAKMLNENVFGKHEKGIRDKASQKQIEALNSVEQWDAAFVHLNIIDKKEREALIDGMLNRHFPNLEQETTLSEPIRLKITAPAGQRVLVEFGVEGGSS